MAALGFDLRDAVRGLRRDKLYAATIVITLALTIGATTAAFSIVDGVLLQPLSYRESQRLVSVQEVWQEFVSRAPSLAVNERHFDYWRQHAQSFASMAQYRVLAENLTGPGDAAQIAVARTSGTLFDVLGTPAAIGRTLTPADEADGAADVVTITDGLWRRRFNAAPAIVGQAITIGGRAHTVVGVLPSDFRLPTDRRPGMAVDAFRPLRIDVGWVGDHNDVAIARLRPGVSVAQAQAELDVLQKQVSEIATRAAHEPVTLSSTVTPLSESVVGTARRGLLLLLGAVAAVLLMACSNLANLALTRTLGRLRDAAIRSALGAGRERLLGRVVLEHVVLAVIGGALGLWVAWAALAIFVRTAPVDLPRVDDVALDTRVFAFAAALSVCTGILTAAVPAWRLARRDVQGMLLATATTVAGDRGGMRAHRALLAAQVGLCVTLLVVGALFGVSLTHVLNVDLGFSVERVIAIDVALPELRYQDEPARQAAYDRLLDALRALPGIQQASTTSLLPLRGEGQVNFIAREGNTLPTSELPSANFRFVSPDFFRTIGMPLRRGRSFTDGERDPNRPAPVVVSEPVAARLWPGEDPIGKRFSRGIASEQGFEVVGVVGDARTTSFDRIPPLMVYAPYWWRSRASLSILVRSAGTQSIAAADVRRVVRAVDPEIAIGDVRPLEQLADAALAGRRYLVRLFAAFGLVALFIATIGVYAATTYGVAKRRREMNLRVALGARPSQVTGLILRQGSTPVLIGVVAGAAGAVALGGVVSNLLFEVAPRDPRIIGGVVALVAVVSLATSSVVTRRRLAIDPARALREE